MRVTLASWNVHSWIGMDGVRDPDRSMREILGFDADVVVLQEVEGDDWRRDAASCGYRAIMGRTGEREYGNALLSRLPLSSIRRVDLSVPGRERRGALDVQVKLAGGRLRVVGTHLGLRPFERRWQAARLGRHLESRDTTLPVVLLGDMNDWTPWGRQLGPLTRAVGRLSRLSTFPSRRPVLPLDRAAWRTPSSVARLYTLRSKAVRRASDHLPLVLELEPNSTATG